MSEILGAGGGEILPTGSPPPSAHPLDCECKSGWTYNPGVIFGPYNDCERPNNDWPVPWCYVDNSTCLGAPCQDTGGYWGPCNAIGDTRTKAILQPYDCNLNYPPPARMASAPPKPPNAPLAPPSPPPSPQNGFLTRTPVSANSSSSTSPTIATTSSSSSTGAIAGGVAAGVVLLLLLILALCLRRRSKRLQREKDAHLAKLAANSFLAEHGGGDGKDKDGNRAAIDSDEVMVSYKSNRTSSSMQSLRSAALARTISSHTNASILSQLPSVPWSDWEMDRDEIEICKRPDGRDWLLGAGAFGKVYKATRRGVLPVAVKIVNAARGGDNGENSNDNEEDFLKEVSILKNIHSPNIVQFQGACLGEKEMMLVTEFMEGGNLCMAIRRGHVTWWKRGKNIALNTAQGLHFLHSLRIVHFDLKSPNILLTRDGNTAKVADVGLARVLNNRMYISRLDATIGTFAWAAPELLLNDKCTEKVDIFSLGVVLWEIVTGERPSRGDMREPRVPDECPAELWEVIQECLQADPRARPSAEEVVKRLQAVPADAPKGVTLRSADSTASLSHHSRNLSGNNVSNGTVHSNTQNGNATNGTNFDSDASSAKTGDRLLPERKVK